MDYKKQVEIYDQLVEMTPGSIRKGKTTPYTSDNGHMYSFVNKDAEIGIRFSNEEMKQLIEEFKTTQLKSHGAFMKGYVLIPNERLKDLTAVSKLLKRSHEYVLSLKPK